MEDRMRPFLERSSRRVRGRIGLAFATAALALVVTAPPGVAATIDVPPITINQLRHWFVSGFGPRDGVVIPGTDYTSSGFTAAIGVGDVVRVRVQAPPGKKFRVRGPAAPATGFFHISVYWPGSNVGAPTSATYSTTFENFAGVSVSPTPNYALVVASNRSVEVWLTYATQGDFEFTAFRVDINVVQAPPAELRSFGDVISETSPSIDAGILDDSTDRVVMEIVDDAPVPSVSTSWGRIKLLYR
jgi:hypothetical protein